MPHIGIYCNHNSVLYDEPHLHSEKHCVICRNERNEQTASINEFYKKDTNKSLLFY